MVLLTIGADLRSTADLHSEIYPQPMFWYHVVGMLEIVALGCFVVGWLLWLGAIFVAWPRRDAVLRRCFASPLRICAGVVLIAGVLATGWLALRMPGLGSAQDPLYRMDEFYRVARSRQLLPFSAAAAGIALIVWIAAGTAMARRRLAATGLWLILAGAVLVLGFVGAEVVHSAPTMRPIRVENLAAARSEMAGYTVLALAMIALLTGILLWVSARFIGTRRDGA